MGRLYLVSDVLYNSGAVAKGAARYRTSFQELLPDAFEKLGRQWFRRLTQGRPEYIKAESVGRRVLAAWKEWDIFPPLFLQGLESLLFAPVLEATSPEDERDSTLRSRLARWCNAADAARLPYAARLRGLAGSASATSVCRARLCHYERYWYRPGMKDVEEDDPWGEGLRQVLLSRRLSEEVSEEMDPNADLPLLPTQSAAPSEDSFTAGALAD